jgi:hypothetical protein
MGPSIGITTEVEAEHVERVDEQAVRSERDCFFFDFDGAMSESFLRNALVECVCNTVGVAYTRAPAGQSRMH